MKHLENRKDIAIQAAYEAGNLLRSYNMESIDAKFKGQVDLVTGADTTCEKLIMDHIHQTFPDDAILSEEHNAHAHLDSGWIIDPLDGTTNFSRGYPLFGPSIAWRSARNRVDIGVVYNPLLDEMFWAVRGGGAWCNQSRLQVSQTDDLSHALLSGGTPYDLHQRPDEIQSTWNHLMLKTLSLRQDGSAALDLCHVAAGRTDAHFEVGLAPWDVAAGILLVEEAGGTISTYHGGSFTLSSPSILASNNLLHDILLSELNRQNI